MLRMTLAVRKNRYVILPVDFEEAWKVSYLVVFAINPIFWTLKTQPFFFPPTANGQAVRRDARILWVSNDIDYCICSWIPLSSQIASWVMLQCVWLSISYHCPILIIVFSFNLYSTFFLQQSHISLSSLLSSSFPRPLRSPHFSVLPVLHDGLAPIQESNRNHRLLYTSLCSISVCDLRPDRLFDQGRHAERKMGFGTFLFPWRKGAYVMLLSFTLGLGISIFSFSILH